MKDTQGKKEWPERLKVTRGRSGQWVWPDEEKYVGEVYVHLPSVDALIREARATALEELLPGLRAWKEDYAADLFKEEKAPFTSPDSAAGAMGRHILGLLIKDIESAAAAARAGESREEQP